MVDAFGASRINVKPPERGIFPLDHDGECKETMKKYLECLKSHESDHFKCRDQSKQYLQCRMDVDLMAKEDLNNLGFGSDPSYTRKKYSSDDDGREKQGFTAGLGVKPSKKGGVFW